MKNKVGFTEEQQEELSKVIGVVARAAWLVTTSTTGTPTEIANAARQLIGYMRKSWNGPLDVMRALTEVALFCDLSDIIVAREAPPEDAELSRLAGEEPPPC